MSFDYINGDGTYDLPEHVRECRTCHGIGIIYVKEFIDGKPNEIIDEDDYYRFLEEEDNMSEREVEQRGFVVGSLECPECEGAGYMELENPNDEYEND